MDGTVLGDYFCETAVSDAHTTFQSPKLKLNRGTLCGSSQWQAFWKGQFQTCKGASITGEWFFTPGLEVGGTNTDQNIDVRYYNVEIRVSGQTWYDFDADFLPTTVPLACIDSGYGLTIVNDRQFTAFEVPYE